MVFRGQRHPVTNPLEGARSPALSVSAGVIDSPGLVPETGAGAAELSPGLPWRCAALPPPSLSLGWDKTVPRQHTSLGAALGLAVPPGTPLGCIPHPLSRHQTQARAQRWLALLQLGWREKEMLG